MENKENKGSTIKHQGVSFFHLKGKFAVVNSRGNLVSDFNLTGEQVAMIYRFLDEGVFEGMFDEIDRSVYRMVLGLKYDAKGEGIKNKAERKMLVREFTDKLNELDTYQKGRSILFRDMSENVRQPE